MEKKRKKIIVCCDGTWDRRDQTTAGIPCPSNVAKLYNALAPQDLDGLEQKKFYIEGVGTGRWDHLWGGAFGFGLSKNVRGAYREIAKSYRAADEIILIGFSRGAFTARSTAGFIRNCGLLRPENLKMLDVAYAFYKDRDPSTKPSSTAAVDFRRKHACHEPGIRCIAVWDTVGALGIPINGLRWVNVFNRQWRFHDTDLSTKVRFAFQALAIDQRRNSFEPSVWTQQAGASEQTLEQMWFSGSHGDVGGGNRDNSLADVALMWIVERLTTDCRVAFLDDGFSMPPAKYLTRPNPLAQLTESWTGGWRVLRPYSRTLLSSDSEWIASTAKYRYKKDDNYSPANLIPHLDNKERFVRIEPRRTATGEPPRTEISQPLVDPDQVDAAGILKDAISNGPRATRPRAATSAHPMPGHRRPPDWHPRQPGRSPRT